jgi:hypothetical protein
VPIVADPVVEAVGHRRRGHLERLDVVDGPTQRLTTQVSKTLIVDVLEPDDCLCRFAPLEINNDASR